MEITNQILSDFKAGRIYGFYNEVYPSLLLYATRCLGANHGFLAEDCVQECVFKAFSKSSDFGSPFQLKSYLYICIHNYAVSVLRKSNSSMRYISEQDNFDEDISRSIIYQETIDLLYRALKELPDDLYQVYELSFERGMKNAEVAQIMGLSESSIKKKKAQMIHFLRERFGSDKNFLLLLAILSLASN